MLLCCIALLHAQTQRPMNTNSSAPTDKESLDLLLQHYQQAVDNTTHVPNRKAVCWQCLQNNTKCMFIPDLGSCLQCETNRYKCSFLDNDINSTANNNNNNKRLSNTEDTTSIKKRKNDNMPNDSSSAQFYSNFIQNLYNSMSPGDNSINNNNNNNAMIPPVSNQYFPPPSAYQHNYNNNNNINNINNINPISTNFMPPPPPPQFPRSSFYVGPTSIYDSNIVNSIKLDSMDQLQISPSMSLRKVSQNVQFILREDHDQALYIKQEQEVDLVEGLVHPHGKILIDIFFKLIHPFYPILHERVFLEKYTRSYRELTAPLLATIYSLALQWWDFHPKLIGFNKPDIVPRLNDLAYTLFLNRLNRPKLSMIQTGLLLLQCRADHPDNWIISSNVVALTEELGLGVDCHDWKLPKWEKDLRKRLAWAVWTQDKWIALLEGRHSHLILGRNWIVNLLQRDNFPAASPTIELDSKSESSLSTISPSAPLASTQIPTMGNYLCLFDIKMTTQDFQNGTLMFQQTVSLSIIVGEIMDTFYTQGAIHVNTNIEQVLKLAKPLQLKLREWYHSLPTQLSMTQFTPKKFNSNATLTLSYFAAELTLHRKIISSLNADTPRELVQVCRTAAKTRLIAAIDFVRDLKIEHTNSFWYSNSTGNFMLIGTFAGLLYVTAPTREESIVFRDLMRNYVWILRVGSKSFEKLKVALNNMHMLLAQVPGLLTDEIPQEFVPPKSHSQMFRYQQQFQQHNPSSSPAITDQGSGSPLVTNIPNTSNNFNTSNNNSSNSPVPNELFQAVPNFQNTNNNKSNSNANSPAVSSRSPNIANNTNQSKASTISDINMNTGTPRSAGRTPTFDKNVNAFTPDMTRNIPASVNEREDDNKSMRSNGGSSHATPGEYKAQYSPSRHSQVSEAYSVGTNSNNNNNNNITFTPRNEPDYSNFNSRISKDSTMNKQSPKEMGLSHDTNISNTNTPNSDIGKRSPLNSTPNSTAGDTTNGTGANTTKNSKSDSNPNNPVMSNIPKKGTDEETTSPGSL